MADTRDEWRGKGWYTIRYSDGGEDWTDNGAIWIDNDDDFVDIMGDAAKVGNEAHIPYAEFHGEDILPDECLRYGQDWCDFEPNCVSDEVWRLSCVLSEFLEYGSVDLPDGIDSIGELVNDVRDGKDVI